jgi:hypothetical protein
MCFRGHCLTPGSRRKDKQENKGRHCFHDNKYNYNGRYESSKKSLYSFNKGCQKLSQTPQVISDAIDQLIEDIEGLDIRVSTIEKIRMDADRVHSEGFYFFDIHIHRTFVLIDLDDDGEATVIWVGSHDEYERTFKNNRYTIKHWLRNKGYIR